MVVCRFDDPLPTVSQAQSTLLSRRKCPLEDMAPRGQHFGCRQVQRGSNVVDVGSVIPPRSDPTVVVTQATPLCVCVVAPTARWT